MTKSQTAIVILATRMVSAYRRMRPRVGCEMTTMKASMAAAASLLQSHLDDERIPLDPELYVIAQANRSRGFSPWTDLAGPAALRSYKRQVRKIVQSLRKELLREIDRAEKKMAGGESVYQVLMKADLKITAMTRYILAQRVHRGALASRFFHDAVAQHRSCPLYKQAVADLLAADLYPDPPLLETWHLGEQIRHLRTETEDVSVTQWN